MITVFQQFKAASMLWAGDRCDPESKVMPLKFKDRLRICLHAAFLVRFLQAQLHFATLTYFSGENCYVMPY